MRLVWRQLGESDRAAFWTAAEFLEGRLSDSSSVQWALDLEPGRRTERLAIAHVLHNKEFGRLKEPWKTIWSLIEESFWGEENEIGMASAYEIQQRIAGGNLSGTLIPMICALVAPKVRVERSRTFGKKKNDPPKAPGDIIRPSLTSQQLISPDTIGLNSITDIAFLTALANALEAEVQRGMDAGRRVGWDGKSRTMWRLGLLYHIRFIAGENDGHDPDQFHRGIAPAVKLLFATVEHIAQLDVSVAKSIVAVWRIRATPIDMRLWAAAAADRSLVSGEEVESFLLSVDDLMFWNIQIFPEVAALRARRFSEFSRAAREAIAIRLTDLPPSDHWPDSMDAEELEKRRRYWAVRELRRIEVYGADLPTVARTWMQENITRFENLSEMREDEGFMADTRIKILTPQSSPDPKYDSMQGEARLKALESAWEAGSDWRDDSARQWLEQEGRPSKLLEDIQATGDGGANFPHVWLHLGQCHKRSDDVKSNRHEVQAFLSSIEELPDETLSVAIEGIAHWMHHWRGVIVSLPNWSKSWSKTWPVAVDSTNSYYKPEDVGRLDALVQSTVDSDLDAYSTPVADLLGVFLEANLSATSSAQPFRAGSNLRRARDAIDASKGQALLIARHRLIEWLPHFLTVCEKWAKQKLVAPLREAKPGQLTLWRALSRERLSTDVLQVIGRDVVTQANNRDLDTTTRSGLVFSVVVEALDSLCESRVPAIPDSEVHQMLRLIDGETRAHAAETIVQFMVEVGGETESSKAEFFRSVALPFLNEVWPQDQTLATPDVSRALAELPVRAGNAFEEAVTAIQHLLVPFACYSIMDYGFDIGQSGGGVNLELIGDSAKASALLELLDRTISTHETAIFPEELSDALAQIRNVDSKLAKLPKYLRLEAISRR